MDAITSTQRKRKKKSVKKKIKVKGEDRISSLPDNILDFVYMQHERCDDNIMSDKTQKFMDFVEKVLNQLDATVLNKFCLFCAAYLDMPRVNVWISTVVGRKVRELILELIDVGCPVIIPVLHLNCECLTIKCAHEEYFQCSPLPPTLFDCELLKNNCLEFIPKDPASISLSKLKVLHISSTEISFDQEIQQVSFSFPSLEEADLMNCIWVNVKTISFFVPRLKRLTLVNDDKDRDDKRDSNFEDYCKIKVYAESLVFLNISIFMSMKVSLYNVSSLNEASIYTSDYNCKKDDTEHYCVSTILGAVTNVRDLSISDVTMDGLNDAEFSSHVDEPNYGWKIERTPQPILLNLKLVEISDSYGHENELSMVEYLLLNARALEMIYITMCPTNCFQEEKKEFTKNLLLHLMEQGQDFTFSCI